MSYGVILASRVSLVNEFVTTQLHTIFVELVHAACRLIKNLCLDYFSWRFELCLSGFAFWWKIVIVVGKHTENMRTGLHIYWTNQALEEQANPVLKYTFHHSTDLKIYF